MNHGKTECDTKCKQHTINAQYVISIDCPEKKLKGENCMKAKGVCPDRVHSDQMVLGMVRRGGWTAWAVAKGTKKN
jgi:hypothetical protein